MPEVDADRNALFGILAFRLGLIEAWQLAVGCTLLADPDRQGSTMGQLCVEQGWLTPERCRQVDELLERELRSQGGDTHKALLAASDHQRTSPNRPVVQYLAAILVLGLVGLAAVAVQLRVRNGRLRVRNGQLETSNRALAEANFRIQNELTAARPRTNAAENAIGEITTAVNTPLDSVSGPEFARLRKSLSTILLGYYESCMFELGGDRPATAEECERIATVVPGVRALALEVDNQRIGLGSLQKAQALLEKAIQAKPADAAYRDELALLFHHQGVLLADLGRASDALAAHLRAIEIWEHLARVYAGEPYAAAYLAAGQERLGTLLREVGRFDEALRAASQALEYAEQETHAHPESARAQEFAARIQCQRGLYLFELGYRDEAIAACRRAVEIREGLARERPDDAQSTYLLAQARIYLGATLFWTDRVDDALPVLRQALEAAERITRAHPAVADYQDEAANAHHLLGQVLQATGENTEASDAYGRALAIWEQQVRDHPDSVLYRAEIADCLEHIGELREKTFDTAAALESIERARQFRERLARESPDSALRRRDLAKNHCRRGDVYFTNHSDPEAITAYREALRIQPDWYPAHVQLAALLNRQGGYAGALASLRRARECVTAQPGNAPISDEALRTAERRAALEARLPAVLAGKQRPKDGTEWVVFARMCVFKKLYGSAARLFDEGFREQPALAQDTAAWHRSIAARAAAQAGCGQGADQPPLSAAEKARWREQARTWLREEFTYRTSGSDKTEPLLMGMLMVWSTDPGFSCVREEAELAKLPESERDPWRALWAEVDRAFMEAQERLR